jgi:hypothetical protein
MILSIFGLRPTPGSLVRGLVMGVIIAAAAAGVAYLAARLTPAHKVTEQQIIRIHAADDHRIIAEVEYVDRCTWRCFYISPF